MPSGAVDDVVICEVGRLRVATIITLKESKHKPQVLFYDFAQSTTFAKIDF